MNLWPLIGVAVVVGGFALRLNALLVVVAAGVATGLVAGIDPPQLLETFGNAFARNRFLLIFVLTFPAIGLLEREGLREHAQAWIARLRNVTAARLLIVYLAVRQFTAALGLTGIADHAQTVRPLLSPMAEAAAVRDLGELDQAQRQRLAALCAATDNVGRFFGEDIFIAFGAVLLIQGFLSDHGLDIAPLSIALWGIPTAVSAFAIHALRIAHFERQLRRALQALRVPHGADRSS